MRASPTLIHQGYLFATSTSGLDVELAGNAIDAECTDPTGLTGITVSGCATVLDHTCPF